MQPISLPGWVEKPQYKGIQYISVLQVVMTQNNIYFGKAMYSILTVKLNKHLN